MNKWTLAIVTVVLVAIAFGLLVGMGNGAIPARIGTPALVVDVVVTMVIVTVARLVMPRRTFRGRLVRRRGSPLGAFMVAVLAAGGGAIVVFAARFPVLPAVFIVTSTVAVFVAIGVWLMRRNVAEGEPILTGPRRPVAVPRPGPLRIAVAAVALGVWFFAEYWRLQQTVLAPWAPLLFGTLIAVVAVAVALQRMLRGMGL